MNSSLFRSLFALSLVGAASAHAQVYVEANVGGSHYSNFCKLSDNCKNVATSARGLVGYGFGNGLSAEFGYTEFGKVKDTKGKNERSGRTGGWTLGAAYRLPLSESFSADFRAGAMRAESKFRSMTNGVSRSVSESLTAPYVGVGLSYSLNKNTSIGTGVTVTRYQPGNGVKSTIQTVDFGVRQQF